MSKEREKVFCKDGTVCGGENSAWRNEIEPDQVRHWVCLDCQRPTYGVDIIDFLKTKMNHIKKAAKDKYRFAVRELVQNADDVNAKIVTIRIDQDALYVANDGHPFRQPSKGFSGDFIRICRVLSRPKAKDSETTGAHGSGFQTVYCFTNHPEVNSTGISAVMDPTRADENSRIRSLKSERSQMKNRSPYGGRGVLFRFPWRTEKEARRDYDGRQPFSSPEWPRWNARELKNLAENLVDYLHDLALCCQHVEMIRLIWGDPARGYQVQRTGFSLDSVPGKPYTAQIEEGSIDIHQDWEDSFQPEKCRWSEKKNARGHWSYLVGSAHVTDSNGTRMHYGENEQGKAILTAEFDELADDKNNPTGKRVVQKGNVHVILPLFGTTERLANEPSYYRYSVLPIPYIGSNRFACTAHVIVDEDRASLRFGEDIDTEWFERVIISIKELYLELYDEYIGKVDGLKLSQDMRQRLILDRIPGNPLHSWIDPKDVMARELGQDHEDLMDAIVHMRILYSDGMLISPMDANWVENDDTKWLVRKLGGTILTDAFVGHDLFHKIESRLEEIKFDENDFLELWGTFWHENNVSDSMTLNQKLNDGSSLDSKMVEGLIRYCLESKDPGTRTLPVVPDNHGTLRPISNFPYIPKKYESLNELLNDEKRIHRTFKNLVRSLRKEESSPRVILRALSDAVESERKRFEDMNTENQRLIAKVVVSAVTDGSFALEDVKDCRFIPFEYRGTIQVGEPNKEPNGQLLDYNHIGESYERHHIFKEQQKDVPGLTKELKRGVKSIHLPGVKVKKKEEVEKGLRLVALFEKKSPRPTNFVRVLISPRYDSLFHDQVLRDFLHDNAGLPEKVITRRFLEGQKIALLEAVKAYFCSKAKGTESGLTSEDMKDVPCLYDPQGCWHKAGSFAIEIDETLRMLRKHPLHKDFSTSEWTEEVLVNRLGVCKTPTMEDVARAISEFANADKEGHREDLKRILVHLLRSNIELIDERGIQLVKRPEIGGLEWVPTRGDGFSSVEECIVPTDENLKIMGKDYSQFLDVEPEVLDDSEGIGILGRVGKIGIRASPSTNEMLRLIKERFELGENPPPKLFDELSREKHTSKDGKYRYEVYAKVYFSHTNGKWWDAEDIRIADDIDVPDQLRTRYLLLRPDSTHLDYLRYFLGVEEGIYEDDLLECMTGKDVEIDLNLWSYMSRARRSFGRLKEKYGSHRIFPNPNDSSHLVRPDRIVLKDFRTFKEPGPWGDWFILDTESQWIDSNLKDLLKRLGARRFKDLSTENLQEILESMAWDGKRDDPVSYRNMMRLLLALGRKNTKMEFIELDKPCAPIRTPSGIEIRKISECYLNDTHKTSLFRDKLPILDHSVDGEYQEDLRMLYVDNDARSLDEALKTTSKRRPEDEKPEKDGPQTRRMEEIRKALSIHFDRNVTDPESRNALGESIHWLDNCMVHMYDDIKVEYKVGKVKSTTSGYDLEEKDGIYKINVARVGTEKMLKDLAADIFKTCERVRFSDELMQRESEIILIVSNLLSSDPDHWGYAIQGYSFKGDQSIPPLVEIVEFTTEGYFDTRMDLKNWYNSCQICMGRTPYDESGLESCEGVTNIVSLKGGRYHGSFDRYQSSRCMFLCPTHQTLYKRGLVRIPYLEEGFHGETKKALDKIDAAMARLNKRLANKEIEKGSIIKDTWEVYETPVEDFKTSESAWSWNERLVNFKAGHLLELLRWSSKHLGGMDVEEG